MKYKKIVMVLLMRAALPLCTLEATSKDFVPGENKNLLKPENCPSFFPTCPRAYSFACRNSTQTINTGQLVTFTDSPESSSNITQTTTTGTTFTVQQAGVYFIQFWVLGLNLPDIKIISFQVFKKGAGIPCAQYASDGFPILGTGEADHRINGFVVIRLAAGDTIDLRNVGGFTFIAGATIAFERIAD